MTVPPISNGIYKIANAQFPNIVADLIYPDNGTIVGYSADKDTSKNVQWNVTNILPFRLGPQNEVTMMNQDVATYASVQLQQELNLRVGGGSAPLLWSVNPTPTGHYYILFLEVFCWTLRDGNDGTPISLEFYNLTTNDPKQLWTFEPVD